MTGRSASASAGALSLRAVVAIIVAGVFDGIDGRIARLLKGTSEFGADFDSLSDFVSFGVAPALLMYSWSMCRSLSSLGWMIALLFTICCGLRLARFNTQIGADLPPYAYNFFTGVPAPAGAGLALIPMLLNFEFGWSGFRSAWFGAVVLAAVGTLMVSRVPTFSMKRFHLPREWVLPVFLIIGGLAALATTEPWAMLLIIGIDLYRLDPAGASAPIAAAPRRRRDAAPRAAAS